MDVQIRVGEKTLGEFVHLVLDLGGRQFYFYYLFRGHRLIHPGRERKNAITSGEVKGKYNYIRVENRGNVVASGARHEGSRYIRKGKINPVVFGKGERKSSCI